MKGERKKMIWFIIGIILFLIAIGCFIYAFKTKETVSTICGVVGIVLALIACGISCLYTQDVGETIVLRSIGGNVTGHTEDAGFHTKLPWEDVIAFDTRNNLINMYGEGTGYSYDGGSAIGAEITINDASGAQADIDIQVNYSIDPSIAEYLYSEYGTQTTFTQNYVSQDVRAVAREVSGQFSTITLLTDRSQYTQAIEERLTEKWSEIGLTVEQVTVQDVRYPENITTAYAEAQAAEVAKQKALNEQETAKVEAETLLIESQAQADANAILQASLSDQVLQQQYIEALKSIGANGNLIVVPEGTSPLITTN